MRKCKVEGCNSKHIAKGYCSKHYQQMKRYGQILDRTIYDANEIVEYEDHAEIVLYDKDCNEVARALIDIDDINKVKNYKWHVTHYNYVYSKTRNLRLHRLIMDCPDDMVVDHINHNRLANRQENLRICTQHQNNMNTSIRSDNTSGTTGVSLDTKRNKWRSTIYVNGKEIHLGYCNTKEEAIQVRKNAEIEYFGEYRNTNN